MKLQGQQLVIYCTALIRIMIARLFCPMELLANIPIAHGQQAYSELDFCSSVNTLSLIIIGPILPKQCHLWLNDHKYQVIDDSPVVLIQLQAPIGRHFPLYDSNSSKGFQHSCYLDLPLSRHGLLKSPQMNGNVYAGFSMDFSIFLVFL